MSDRPARIYLDHNATSPLREEVRETWLEALSRCQGNASSQHAEGRRARQQLDEARSRVAQALRVPEGDVLFTSGGTEADVLAMRGCLSGPHEDTKPPFAMASTEHAALRAAAQQLASEGHPLTWLETDELGFVTLEEQSFRNGTPRWLSVALANNEVGTVQDLASLRSELSRRFPEQRVLLHTDAVQALGRLHLGFVQSGVDLATLSAHKVGGPLGVGILYRATSVPLMPIQGGGGQEAGLRGGTENVPAIVAAAHAVELAVEEVEQFAAHTRSLAQAFWNQLLQETPTAQLIGPPIGPHRLCNTLSVHLPGLDMDARMLVTRLDLEGVAVSAGSACSSGSREPSPVLLAMGLDEERARAVLRVSFGRTNKRTDAVRAADILSKIFSSARNT